MPMSSDPNEQLTKLLCRLPGIGQVTAERLSLFISRAPSDYSLALSAALSKISLETSECPLCHDSSIEDLCPTCIDPKRDPSLLCIVQTPQDKAAIEKTGSYNGHYHILHGLLDPINGKGPADLNINSLLGHMRPGCAREAIKEIIIATGTSAEGDVTALFIANLMRDIDITVTRISSGIPAGRDIEYTDKISLSRALEHRMEINSK